MTRVGTAVVEVPVPAGTPMAGFAARTSPSTGTHDPLTVRALTLDDLVWVTVDVCGLHEDTCAEIALAAADPAQVRVSATHTHAGPCVMPGRLGGAVDPLRVALVRAAATAVDEATRTQVEANVDMVSVPVADVAFDRRRQLPVVADLQAVVARQRGRVAAALVTFPCHPVVLGADNRLISGDYPAVVRQRLEEGWPGAVVLFATGCAGDVNTGHASTSSYSQAASPRRSFAEAERVGARLAKALLTAPAAAASDRQARIRSARADVVLDLAILDAHTPDELAAGWRAESERADPGTAALLKVWADWADRQETVGAAAGTWTAQVSAAALPGGWLVGLPGEPFLGVAGAVRAALGDSALVLGYTDGCPGYFPLASDYADGGYEVRDAHRYYGMAAPFRAGSAERLIDCVLTLTGELA